MIDVGERGYVRYVGDESDGWKESNRTYFGDFGGGHESLGGPGWVFDGDVEIYRGTGHESSQQRVDGHQRANDEDRSDGIEL